MSFFPMLPVTDDQWFDLIIDELSRRNSGRWPWEDIDCCWTGKDADLHWYGHQGCRLKEVKNGKATVDVHSYKLFAGEDVALNLPDKVTAKDETGCHEVFMAGALVIIQRSGVVWNWSGEDWELTYKGEMTVSVAPDCHPIDVRVRRTVDRILHEAEHLLTDWERRLTEADRLMDVLTGWKHRNGRICREGKPGPGSAWTIYRLSYGTPDQQRHDCN